MKGKTIFFIILLAFWTILSERITVESFLIGIIVCIFVMKLNSKAEERNKIILRKPFLIIKLIILLIKDIFISNIEVAKIVLSKDMDIDPEVFIYKTELNSERLKVLFANTITLTPGTITVSLDGNELIIHALKESNKYGIENSDIEKLLLQIEERS
ncbi:MAG: Na+/H+ antiporter subunit E [Andreesenia angusta]|nr:Na+/H+ antiporter subunit E [Andreesenia angusta]